MSGFFENNSSRPEAILRLQVLHAVPDFLGEFFNLLGFLNAGNRQDIFIRFADFFLERGGQLKELFDFFHDLLIAGLEPSPMELLLERRQV